MFELLNPRDTARAGNNGNRPIDWDNKHEHLKDILIANFEELGLTGAVFTAGKSGKIPYGQIKKYFRNNDGIITGGNDTITGTTHGNRPENLRFYYHPDHLGSSSYITDVSGEVYQHMEYFPFGETFIEERTDGEYTTYLFNGKEFDEETGLYYYGARYYDPRTSVWQSVDQLMEKFPNHSPFSFNANNPIGFVDVDGNSPDPYTRLIFWGGARKLGDNSAFWFASRNVIKDYGNDGNVQSFKAKSGAFIINTINSQKDNSIQSVDFFTHGSQYALYMVSDKKSGMNSSTSQTIPKDVAESNNLYSSNTTKLFQSWGGGNETDVINNIDFDKFTVNAKIEIHGCKSAAGTIFVDNLATNLSEALYDAGKTRSVVIGHLNSANPRISGDATSNKEQDYRHGTRIIYHNGEELFRTNKKGRISAKMINKHLDKKLNN